MKQQRGFTLIELIVVIVILGILAATALPRFTNLTVDARVAKMQGVAAGIKGAVSMAHGAALAENIVSTGSLHLENGATVTLSNYYPTADATGIVAALDTTGLSVTYASATLVNFSSDSGRASCVVTYSQADTATATSAAIPTVDDSFVTSSALYNQHCI